MLIKFQEKDKLIKFVNQESKQAKLLLRFPPLSTKTGTYQKLTQQIVNIKSTFFDFYIIDIPKQAQSG